MNSLCFLIGSLTQIVFLIVIAHVIFSWLFALNILNYNNYNAQRVYAALDAMIAPLLYPIRKIIPNFGGIDFSPIILLLGLQFIEILLLRDILPLIGLRCS